MTSASVSREKTTAMAPTSGIAPATVSQGKVLISSPALSLQPHQQERADQQDGTQEHGQRIRAHETRLHPAQPARPPAEGRRHGVDKAVDAAVVEVDRQP